MQTSGFWVCRVSLENSVTVEEKLLLGPDLTPADDCYLKVMLLCFLLPHSSSLEA